MKGQRSRLELRQIWISRSWIFARVVLCVGAIAAIVIGCPWYGPVDSVRFNDFLKGHDFFRLPPLPKGINSVNGKLLRWYDREEDDLDWEADEKKRKQRENDIEGCWRQADAAEQRGDWEALRHSLNEYLKLTLPTRDGVAEPDVIQARRNAAQDRLDALQSLAQGGSVKAVRAYLATRAVYENQPAGLREQLDQIPLSSELQDNVAYLRAALLYKEASYEEAEHAFKQVTARYPRSEKREAALLMAAIATMKQSCSFLGTCKDEAQNAVGSANALCEACRDGAWKRARQAFLLLLSAYPRGRYVSDAHGWLGYLARLSGDRAGALIEYYRQLAADEPRGKLDAVFSLSMVRRGATAAEMEQVERELADEPAAALAYAYHNLYNHAYAIEPSLWPSGYKKEEQQKLRVEAHGERQRIAAFAARLLRRYPQASLSSAFALRVAQANLELGEYKAAREMAVRALALGLSSEERKQALWVKGAAEHYLNDYAAARQTFTALIAADNDGNLTEGARRMLAIAAEQAGDWDTALEQYFALGYDTDVAYLIDVLLTPEQLAGFITRHPQAEQRNQLLYALGVRYLRDSHWSEARAALTQVKTQACNDPYDSSRWVNGKKEKFEPKSVSASDGQVICTEWMMRDLKTIDDLERLEHQAATVQGDEAKAEALYQFASYQYAGGTMLFYNPQAWQGGRHWLLSRLAESDSYLLPNEARRHWEAAQAHDALARSLKIYLEVAQRFPQTRAARDALYTAAVCHERLAQMNDYWRGIYDKGFFAGERLVTYRDVKAAYPNYQLPQGTWGWQPVTRTVSNGPAWAAPPKPRPRLTFSQRVRWKADQLWQRSTQSAWDFWNRRLLPLLLGLFFTVCCVAGGYAILISCLVYRRRPSLRLRDELILVNLHSGPELTDDKQSPVERIINAS